MSHMFEDVLIGSSLPRFNFIISRVKENEFGILFGLNRGQHQGCCDLCTRKSVICHTSRHATANIHCVERTFTVGGECLEGELKGLLKRIYNRLRWGPSEIAFHTPALAIHLHRVKRSAERR